MGQEIPFQNEFRTSEDLLHKTQQLDPLQLKQYLKSLIESMSPQAKQAIFQMVRTGLSTQEQALLSIPLSSLRWSDDDIDNAMSGAFRQTSGRRELMGIYI